MTEYEPIADITADTGCPLTQRGHPDLYNFRPKRLITREESLARGWSWYWDGATACRYSHVAARKSSNPKYCADCYRLKAGLQAIYPQSRAQSFYKPPSKPAQATAAPVVIQAPTAPAPLEPSVADQRFLAKLDELRDFDAAAKATGSTRGLIEARASSNPTFRAALDDLVERRGIPRTRAADQEFQWTPQVEKQLVKRFIDTGLLQTARDDLGVSASDYQTHLRTSSAFAGMIREATPLARETLRERATASASAGNDKLLRILEEDGEGDALRHKTPQEMYARLRQIADKVHRATDYRDRRTHEIIPGRDLERVLLDKGTGAVIEETHLTRAFRNRQDGAVIAAADLEARDVAHEDTWHGVDADDEQEAVVEPVEDLTA